jgi:hypothetical protein
MLHLTEAESASFIDRTECTAIPRTIAGDTYEKTLGLTGGADGTLFKSFVGFYHFHVIQARGNCADCPGNEGIEQIRIQIKLEIFIVLLRQKFAFDIIE